MKFPINTRNAVGENVGPIWLIPLDSVVVLLTGLLRISVNYSSVSMF
ncbi:MAG: hypothetical protein ACXV3T_08815 [Halobacteriota archaeon]